MIAPGARIRVRDEEWLVRSVDRSSSGSRIFGVVGLTPLVSGKEARFLEAIEKERGEITIVDPKNTEPVIDTSPYYRKTRLVLESQLRTATPITDSLHLGHRGAMDVLPFQLKPTSLALQQPRQRILIADSVGLGKTIECGILLSELIKRGKGQRILVVAVKSMLTQFQKELWSRFSLPLTRLDSLGLQRVRKNIPSNHNPFHYYDKSIISIDTLKQDGEYRNHLENAWWDIIVIDEAHNVAERGTSNETNSLRSKTAKLLANRSDSLILLSATPHDGKRESFASLMNMLNPTAIKNPKDYSRTDIDGLFIRRFKKDVRREITGNFPDRVVHTPQCPASAEEEAAYEALANLNFSSIDKARSGAKILFRTLLEKSLFSSPQACIATVQERIKRIQKRTPSAEIQEDITTLEDFLRTLNAIQSDQFSKYQNLLALLKPSGPESIGWDKSNSKDRLVIFTERIDTLKFLEKNLHSDLKLKAGETAILYGSMSDTEQQAMVEAFGSEDSPVRLLIASDVASEGINLHHQSHRLLHFDIPWSLLTFQQRNGRVDRYGQAEQPEIYYLQTLSEHPKIRGDQRILELLIEKDHEVQLNIGDPSEFTGLHSIEEEEAAIAQAIESDYAPEAALESTFSETSSSDDWFANLLGEVNEEPTSDGSTGAAAPVTVECPSFYDSDFAWAKEGFETIKQEMPFKVEFDVDAQQIDLSLPAENWKRILKRLPQEIHPRQNGAAQMWSLCADKNAINEEIIQCRSEENRWPRRHLLWEQHPALVWMQDRLLNSFGLHQASCVHLEHMKANERIVVGSAVIPNRKGQPLIERWFGMQYLDGKFNQALDIESLITHTQFTKDFPNSANLKLDIPALKALFADAVDTMTVLMSEARDDFNDKTKPELDAQLAKIANFLKGRAEQVELAFAVDADTSAPQRTMRQQKKERALRKAQEDHDAYKQWIEDTMTTEDAPSIRIFAVFGHFDV